MKRTPHNPWNWSLQYSFNQAETIENTKRQVFCAGQASIDGDGKTKHAGDMPAQIALALDNLEAVLKAAGMTLSNVVQMRVYTTDVDQMLANWGLLAERLGAAKIMPPQTLVGVARLAFPDLMVEIEATAAA